MKDGARTELRTVFGTAWRSGNYAACWRRLCAAAAEGRLSRAALRAIYQRLRPLPGPLDWRSRMEAHRRAGELGGARYIARRYAIGKAGKARLLLLPAGARQSPPEIARLFLAQAARERR